MAADPVSRVLTTISASGKSHHVLAGLAAVMAIGMASAGVAGVLHDPDAQAGVLGAEPPATSNDDEDDDEELDDNEIVPRTSEEWTGMTVGAWPKLQAVVQLTSVPLAPRFTQSGRSKAPPVSSPAVPVAVPPASVVPQQTSAQVPTLAPATVATPASNTPSPMLTLQPVAHTTAAVEHVMTDQQRLVALLGTGGCLVVLLWTLLSRFFGGGGDTPLVLQLIGPIMTLALLYLVHEHQTSSAPVSAAPAFVAAEVLPGAVAEPEPEPTIASTPPAASAPEPAVAPSAEASAGTSDTSAVAAESFAPAPAEAGVLEYKDDTRPSTPVLEAEPPAPSTPPRTMRFMSDANAPMTPAVESRPAASMFDDVERAHNLGTWDAVQECLQVLKDMLSNPNITRREKAECLWRLGRARNAERGLIKDTPSLMQARGIGHGGSTEAEIAKLALDDVRQAVTLDPTISNAHLWHSILLTASLSYVHWKEAIGSVFDVRDHAQKAVQLNPKNALAHHTLGRWCEVIAGLGYAQRVAARVFFKGSPPEATYEEAYTHFHRAEEAEPDFWIANQVKLGEMCIKLKRGREARNWLNKALSVTLANPADAEFRTEAQKLLKSL